MRIAHFLPKLEKKEWFFLLSIIFVGLVLRWLDLDYRPFHHDESLNSIYGKYSFVNPVTGFYKYNPLVHGPLLYNLQPYIYEIFGVSNWTGRMPLAFLGSIFLFVPLFFSRFLTKEVLFIIIGYLSFSPSLIYWSRFVREDFLVFASLIAALMGLFLAPRRLRSYFVFIPLFLHWTTKENFFVTIAILLGYLIYELALLKWLKSTLTPTFQRAWEHLKDHPWQVLFSFLIGFFIFCWLYSAGFRWQAGILDGLYRKSFLYWIGQHSIERIKGPFSFQFIFLGFYELPFVLSFLAHFFHFYFTKSKKVTILTLMGMALILVNYFYFLNRPLDHYAIWEFFKLKIPMDLVLLPILIIHSVIITTYHLYKKERGKAFWGYFFMSQAFTYSYLGEKVPWLSLYLFLPGVVYLALYFMPLIERHKFYLASYPIERLFLYFFIIVLTCGLIFFIQPPHHSPILHIILALIFLGLFVLGHVKKFFPKFNVLHLGFSLALLFNLRAAIMTNYRLAGEASEFIGQVHTTHEIHNLALKIKEDMLYPKSGINAKVLVQGDAVWPLNWYFDGLKGYKFSARPDSFKDFDYIFMSNTDLLLQNVFETHHITKIQLRGWWVPNYEKMNLANFLNYAWSHEPWNEPGYFDINYAVKKTLLSDLR